MVVIVVATAGVDDTTVVCVCACVYVYVCVCVCVLVMLSHVQLCNAMDCSPPGSSVHGILQAYWSGLPFPSPDTTVTWHSI